MKSVIYKIQYRDLFHGYFQFNFYDMSFICMINCSINGSIMSMKEIVHNLLLNKSLG